MLSSNGSGAFVLNVNDALVRDLESKQYGRPLALGTAIRDGITSRRLVLFDEFLRPASYTGNVSSLTWAAARWTWRQLGIANSLQTDDSIPEGRYVVLQNVEEAFREVIQFVASKQTRFDRIFMKSQFKAAISSHLTFVPSLTEEDFEVLLIFLHRFKHLIDYDGRIVRIKGAFDHPAIGEEDVAIASIKELVTNLHHQILILNNRIESLQEEARASLGRHNRVAAKAALRSRKLAEASVAERYNTLSQLETVATSIEQASDQIQFVKAMKSSADALKSLNLQIGSTDRVEEIMDQMREQMAETDEVAAILGERAEEPIDESEVDAALEVLEQIALEGTSIEAGEKREGSSSTDVQKLQDELANLPEPPSSSLLDMNELAVPAVEARVAKLSLDNS